MKIIMFAAGLMLSTAAVAQTAADGNDWSNASTGADLGAGHDDAHALVELHANSTIEGGAYSGMGGPVEERTGYPPCSPGPGDDNCIQLYEIGITGAGN